MEKFKQSKSNLLIEGLDLIRTVLVCVFFVYLITTFIFKPVKVDGSSMYPTLEDGEYGFSFVLGAIVDDFQRFDVVIVDTLENKLYVKRIIGLPNETIEYKDDVLYIDGKVVEEEFLDMNYMEQTKKDNNVSVFTNDFGPITLGDNQYFVMGDNRMSSYDSRQLGAYNVDQLISKSMIIVYPFDKIGYIDNDTK